MSERDAGFYIVDILTAIFQIDEYTCNFENAEEFKWHTMEWDATLRRLEIIGEATKYLITMDILNNREYRKIVDFRNVISHAYFGVDEEEVWYVIKEKLQLYKQDILDIVHDQKINISEAIAYVQQENSKNRKLITYLDSLK